MTHGDCQAHAYGNRDGHKREPVGPLQHEKHGRQPVPVDGLCPPNVQGHGSQVVADTMELKYVSTRLCTSHDFNCKWVAMVGAKVSLRVVGQN